MNTQRADTKYTNNICRWDVKKGQNCQAAERKLTSKARMLCQDIVPYRIIYSASREKLHER